uniref:Uncharacterized protein n=1 Tax=Panagrolaimus davidi TaxID=227884 RepID=A0A914QUC7_9BILA
MQHDTGSAVSIISKKIWLHIGKPKIYATKIELQSYNRMIPVIGQCNVFVQVGKQIKQQCVLVVSKGKALIGRNWINSFDIRLQRLCNSFIHGKSVGFSSSMQNSQRVIHQLDRRVFKDFDKNSEKKISKAEPMHASMQGKENDASGKGVKPRNDGLPAEKTHPQHRESTVRKGFMLQEEKHSNYGGVKDYPKSLNRKTYSCCDQADHSHLFKNRPHRIIRKANAQRRVEREDVHGDDILYVKGTVASVSRRTTSTKQRLGKFNYGHYREVALTGSDEACHVYRDQYRRED